MGTIFNILLGGVLATAISSWVSRSIKISEFRQAWINDLRKDISDFVGVAEKWQRKYDEINALPDGEERPLREQNELFPIANEARVIYRRIQLRFNPRPNQYKEKDDVLLKELLDLLDPRNLSPRNPEASWQSLADKAIITAREVLKREWEVTKKLLPSCCDIKARLAKILCCAPCEAKADRK